MTQKIISGILSLVFLVGTSPALALAETSSADIQAKLTAIAALQAQLNALQTQKGTAVAELTSLLRQGSSGDQVTILQALLAADSSVYPEGLITGYFGAATARAVKRFQKGRGLEQVGNVGPKTLAELKKHLSDNPIAFSNATSTDASGNGQGKRLCAIVPPGHLIAPGWLKKNGGVAPIVPTCQTLPPGILDQLNGTTTPPGLDKTAPVLSAITATPGTTSATIMWTTNESSNSKVVFGTTTSYGSIVTNGSLALSHSLSLSGLATGTLYHFQVTSVDAAGNIATSSDMTFTTGTPDTTAPSISGISISGIGSTTATVLWTTNENATGKVYFATTTPFVIGSASTVSTSTLSTGHSLSLTDLTASSTYSYVIESRDSAGNTGTTSAQTFNTSN